MSTPFYCTREDVKASPEIKTSARMNALVDQKIAAATTSINGLLLRRFYPEYRTVSFDFPRCDGSPSYQLWLGYNELVSVAQVTVGGTATTDYTLKRFDELDEAPYSILEIGSIGFADPVEITGTYAGCRINETKVGVLAQDLAALDTATANVTWNTPRFGVGSILRVDDERMIITERTWVDTGQNTVSELTARQDSVTVTVATGSAFAPEEYILIDGEILRVDQVAGNLLTLSRAQDGTVLAAHAVGADIYAMTGVQLERGALGTTIAAHTTTAPIYRYDVPSLIQELAVAETVASLQQASEAYKNVRQGLDDLRKMAMQEYGRTNRSQAI